jgi:hypothetical protein
MRSADIVVGRHYLADVTYGERMKVEVLEVGVARPRSKRKDGVRVRCLEAAGPSWSRITAGDEKIIAAVKIDHEWSAEDNARHEARGEAQRRAADLRARFDALGIGCDGSWRGEAVSPERTTVSLPLIEAEKLVGLVPGNASA